MKLICAEYNDRQEMTVGVIGDNALLRNNDDFYIPGFSGELSCVPQLVLKMSKLGKGISERFAERYYEEAGVGLRFYADGLERALKQQNLPYGVASSFDHSAALSDLYPWTGQAVYAMELNEEKIFEESVADLPVGPDKLLSQASGYYMIKIGDFMYCGNPFRYRGIKINDHIRMCLNGVCILDFYVR